jgi:hypothetical protein
MNNKWSIAVTIVSLFLNIVMVSIGLRYNTNAASSTITVPALVQGTGYIITIPQEHVTCLDIENQLSLKRGDVTSIMVNQDGIIIQFNKNVLLTSDQVQTATNMVKGLISSVSIK